MKSLRAFADDMLHAAVDRILTLTERLAPGDDLLPDVDDSEAAS